MARASAPSGVTIADQEVLFDFTRAIAAGDLPCAVGCFALDGCLITPGRTTVCGRSHIAPIVGQLISAGAEFKVDELLMQAAGPVALATGHWTITSYGRNGADLDQRFGLLAVVRQVEELWKLAILDPWGSPKR